MLTISRPPIGAIAFGRSGLGHIITALEADRVVLRCPDGLMRVPLGAVIRWELPAKPKTLTPGQRVLLKNTALEFVVIDIYDHFMGWVDGERTYEQWAELQTNDVDGRPAHWKIQQLEEIA
jgi:hypothetical protein